jgi:prolyl-tRNA synthetase
MIKVYATPNLAPIQVVIVPIYKEEQFDVISTHVNGLVDALRKLGISVKYDNRDTQKPGFKFAEWELKGVPVRLQLAQMIWKMEPMKLHVEIICRKKWSLKKG